MTPNQKPEMIDQREVERLIEKFAPKLSVEEPKPLEILVLGENGGPDLRLLDRLRDLSLERGLDLIVHTADLEPPQEPKSDARRMAVVDTGHHSLAKILAEALKCMPFTCEVAEAAVETAALEQPQVMSQQLKAKGASFRQFQNKQRNQGPPVRRQFAQIRPPRRGGR